MSEFARRVIAWQAVHGRHDLPWQGTRDPYRIWLSEVMLQQTQVATVIPYYLRFLARFPDVSTLAAAPLEAVLELWSGLGYYSRARHLHRAARQVQAEHGGRFPRDPPTLETLPGVGRSTAAAIAVFSSGARAAILDGNVKRVFCRHDAIDGHPAQAEVQSRLWRLAQERLPETDLVAYTQGLMDLGAGVCTRSRPACGSCPLAASCAARALGRATAYPAPRPRREVPRVDLMPLVLLCGESVLLQRQPDTGVWGGLWSLPLADGPTPDPGTILARADTLWRAATAQGSRDAGWGRDASSVRVEPLPAFSHALTHRRLMLSPWRVVIGHTPAPPTGDPSLRWLRLSDAEGAALPRPIKRLLLGLAGA